MIVFSCLKCTKCIDFNAKFRNYSQRNAYIHNWGLSVGIGYSQTLQTPILKTLASDLRAA